MSTIHVCPILGSGTGVYGENLRGFAMANTWKREVKPNAIGLGVGNDCIDQTGHGPSALH